MFQLYKARNFNAIINDTFTFFKTSGKDYFKKYFIINGPLVLMLCILFYVVVKVFFENIFAGISSGASPEMMGSFMTGNFILMMFGVGFVSIVVTAFMYSFTVIYMKLMASNQQPASKEILSEMLGNIGKILLFMLCTLITFIPIALIMGMFSGLLIIIIIGIPVAIGLFGAFTCWGFLTFYDNLSTDNGFFTSMGNAWNMLFKNFWSYMGSTLLFFVIIFVFQMFVIFTASMIQGATGLIDPAGSQTDIMQGLGIMMIINFIIQTIINFIVGNLVIVNQGILYYSSQEEQENYFLKNEIDQIGSDVE